jgi:hypothetical protein
MLDLAFRIRNPNRVICWGQKMDGSEAELNDALDRIMQVWSMIKMVPEPDLSVTRASVSAILAEHRHLSEKELLVLGFKHLYGTDDDQHRPGASSV